MQVTVPLVFWVRSGLSWDNLWRWPHGAIGFDLKPPFMGLGFLCLCCISLVRCELVGLSCIFEAVFFLSRSQWSSSGCDPPPSSGKRVCLRCSQCKETFTGAWDLMFHAQVFIIINIAFFINITNISLITIGLKNILPLMTLSQNAHCINIYTLGEKDKVSPSPPFPSSSLSLWSY